MKMKRLLAWLLVLALCFMLPACGKRGEEENFTQPEATQPSTESTEPTIDSTTITTKGTATPLLYRVTDQKGNVAWLFGSIHVGREDYYALPDYVLDAFAGADSLAVEADIVAFEKDISSQIAALTPLVYADGTTIRDHIPQELYEKCVKILEEYQVYSPAMDYYCPAFWGSMIESLLIEELDCDIYLGIDRHLIQRAYKAKKEVLEVESAEFQYKMMADFDADVQNMLLESAAEMYDNIDLASADLKVMMDLWASGDEKAFAEYLNASDVTMTEEEQQIYARYDKAMLTDRNLNMAKYVEDALSGGKEVFVCVGAAHVVGEGALVELLTQRGYTVERIEK